MKIHLKRNGTALIILAVVNFFFELYAFYYLSSESSGWSFGIQNISGILLASLLCIAVGVIALIESEKYCYRARFHHAGFIFILLIPIILLATPGSVSQKVNALLNLTTMPMIMVLYTLALAQKEEQQWKTVKK